MQLSSVRRVLSVALVSIAACGGGQTVPLAPTSAVPAAEGKVEAKHTDQGNTRVHVEVSHLAPPGNVAAGATSYVVWAKGTAADATPKNLGSLQVGSDRKGKLETVTPLDTFELFVTPEASPNAPTPMAEPVMRANIAP